MSMLSLPLVFHPIYSQLNLAKNHRFPIEKYLSLKDAAMQKHGAKVNINLVSHPINTEQLKQIHQTDYIDNFLTDQLTDKEMKRIGFPWSEQFVNRTLTAVGGTLQTVRLAVENGVAINLTGGYHHAHPDFGSGFCVFNDLSIAAQTLLNEGKVNRVLIFDCDVHQGDGTATCVADNPDIFSLSIHCEKNFPTRKQQSDWDIGLDKHLEDDHYLAQVDDALISAFHSFKPDFIIYDAGVDIHKYDDLGLLNITTEGVYQRDLMVFQLAKQHNIPIMAVIGGGYQRDITALTDVHMQLINAAIDTFIN
ncbi:histone deacetylase [uncultured Psychrosphaera sp.]|uniref:histone deacetylase family protein n=1 Tax=uncultured Psychrosphaera sp. TaxID=1403522 RepID=UPI00262F0F73|nr:histone deacetylase [uncultured Psychrosphaera sp.]